MRLPDGGADVWYVDESADNSCFALVAFSVPLMRLVDRTWQITWPDHFDAMKAFRKSLRTTHGIPIKKELHGVKLASGRGRYAKGGKQLGRPAAAGVYRWILSNLSFLQKVSVVTAINVGGMQLYGHKRLQASLYAVFQRMQKAGSVNSRAAMTFFDEGHGEYRKMYRQARVFLPTGSAHGDWGGGKASKNIPMDLFFKDGNFQQSSHSWFVQIADMIAYAAFLKGKAKLNALTPWQAALNLGTLYDAIPQGVLNTYASTSNPQGIVWL